MALIVAATAFAGFKLGEKHIKRRRLYFDVCMFCDFYLNQIRFKNTKLKTLMSDFNGGKEIVSLFSQAVEGMEKEGGEIVCSLLKEDELRDIKTFFMGLGRGDTQSEEQAVGGYKNIFQGKLDEAEVNKKRLPALYTKLGLLLGLLIAILLA